MLNKTLKSRREFMKQSGAAAGLALFAAFVPSGLSASETSGSAASASIQEEVLSLVSENAAEKMKRLYAQIPAWVDEKIEEAYARFAAWKGADEVIVFPIVTDIHAARPIFTEPANFSDSKWHILFAQQAAFRFQADFFTDLGDIGFDRDTNWNPSTYEDARQRLATQVEIYQDFAKKIPTFFAMGNHDNGRAHRLFSELRITPKDYGEMFNRLNPARSNLVLGPNSDYGFFDVPGKKCRVFFLNTSDLNEAGYSPEQLQFLAENLRVPEGFCVVVLQHKCLHPKIGKWNPVREGINIRNGAVCVQILEDFARGGKGQVPASSSFQLSWDFTANKNTQLAGVLNGDSHFDQQAVINGVNYVITQSYGTVSKENLPDFARYRRFSRANQVLIDVAAVKPSAGEMKFFRIGEGGAEFDREFAMSAKLLEK